MSLDIYLNKSVWTGGVTHNLNTMAEEAGLYKVLWRPEEIGIDKAEEAIPLLEEGLRKLQDDPEHYKKYNPENGWGCYEDLVNLIKEYIKYCYIFPESYIEADR